MQALPALEQKLRLAALYLEHFLEDLLRCEANLLTSYARNIDLLPEDRKKDLF